MLLHTNYKAVGLMVSRKCLLFSLYKPMRVIYPHDVHVAMGLMFRSVRHCFKLYIYGFREVFPKISLWELLIPWVWPVLT